MSDNNEFQYSIVGDNNAAAIIKLGEQILGGSQALDYTGALQQLIQLGVKYVIVDLSAVQLINSSGLGMLVSGLSTLRKQEITLILSSVPDKVYGLLEMTHLNKVFIVAATNDDALKICKI